MSWRRWAALAALSFGLWIALWLLAATIFGSLAIAGGFFAGMAVQARKVAILEAKLWQEKQRSDITKDFLTSATDRLVRQNSGEVPVIRSDS